MVVLPEFFATNINYSDQFESEDGGESIRFVKELAKIYNTNIIAGSVVRQKNGKLYNTSFAINRQGEVIGVYDKIHLYNYLGGSEGERITAGQDICTVDFDFAKVGMAICFDIRFPGLFTKLIKENVDIIVLPAAWLVPSEVYNTPEALNVAQDMWLSICRTRAYDNGVYFVVSNQTKASQDNLYGLGHSVIISPTAQVIANAKDKECGIYADIDISLIKYMRQLFPISALS